MTININLADLGSRIVRKEVVPGGVRRIALREYTRTEEDDNSGGVIGKIVRFVVNGAARLVGFLCGIIFNGLGWAASKIWGVIVSTTSFIWNFDWNKSDEAMNAELEAQWTAFGGVLGGFIGQTAGWLITGAVAGSVMFMFNEALAIHVLKELGEEALEELSTAAVGVMQAASRIVGKAIFNWAYQSLRGAITGRDSDLYMSDSQISALIAEKIARGEINQEQGNQLAEKNRKGRDALKAERKPWSFARKWEEYVESIPNEFMKNFVENAFEEFFDAVSEAGYVAAASADAFYAGNRQSQVSERQSQSRQNVLLVQLNRDTDEPTT